MFGIKSSNFLMACLLSGKASLFLINPIQANLGVESSKPVFNKPIEIEVVNLINTSPEEELLANYNSDKGYDYDANNDADKNWRRRRHSLA